MVEAERGALIRYVDGTRAQQVHQPRQPGAKRSALQPRAVGKPDDRGLCGIRGECAERRGRRIVVGRQARSSGRSGACIAGFAVVKQVQLLLGSAGCYALAMTGKLALTGKRFTSLR